MGCRCPSRKLSQDSQRRAGLLPPSLASRHAHAGDIQYRFRYAVDSQILLNHGVFQSRGGKRSKTQPGCRETKCLAKVTGLEQNYPIGPSSTVLPHGPGENRCHDKKRRCLPEVRLIRAVGTRRARARLPGDFCQEVVLGLVVIEPLVETLYPERHQVHLDRVPGTTGRTRLVGKLSEYVRLDVALNTPCCLKKVRHALQ